MAQAIYPNHLLAQYGDATGAHGVVDFEADTFRIYLIDTGTYTYSTAHQDVADLSGIVGTSGDITDIVTAANGSILEIDLGSDVVIDVDSTTSVEAIVLAKWSGSAATSQLIAYDDAVTNFPITPVSADDTITIAAGANGLIRIGVGAT